MWLSKRYANTLTHTQIHVYTHSLKVEVFSRQIYAKSMESRFALCASQIIKMPLESMQHFLVVEQANPRELGSFPWLFSLASFRLARSIAPAKTNTYFISRLTLVSVV